MYISIDSLSQKHSNNMKNYKVLIGGYLSLLFFLHITVTAQEMTGTDFLNGLTDAKAKEMDVAISYRIKVGKPLADDYYNRGALKLIWFKDSAAALQDFNKAIQLDKNKYSAYINRASIREGWKDFSNAEKDLNTAIILKPLDPVVYNNRGYLYHIQKKYNQALLDFDKSIELERKDEVEIIRTYLNKTETLRMMDRIKDAENVFEEVIKLFPKEFKIYVNRSEFYSQIGNWQAALRDLDTAVELSQQAPAMLIERAMFKDDYTNDDKGAVIDCDAAIAKDPTNASFYYARSRPLYDMKKYDIVVEACTKAISLDSNYYNAYVMRGNAHDYLLQGESALSDYEKAIQLNPVEEYAYRELTTYYNKRQLYNKAIATLNRFLVYHPEDIKTKGQVVLLKITTKDYLGAIADADKIIAKDPAIPDAYYLRGIAKDSLGRKGEACSDMETAEKMHLEEAHIYMVKNCKSLLNPKLLEAEKLMEEAKEKERSGDPQGAIELCNRLILLIPDSSVAYYNRGNIKRRMGDHDGGILDMKKCLSLNKKNVEAWVAIANSQQTLGRTEESIASYKKAIEVNPNFAMSYYNLATLMFNQNGFKEAITYGELAVQKDKNYLNAYMLLGEAYFKLGNKEAGCKAYKNASALGNSKADIEFIMNDCK
jgi:tetratricopeptide (TPR) repeat protein